MIYWFGTLDAATRDKYSAQIDEINQSIERIRKIPPTSQDHATQMQKQADKTTADVSALSNKVIPLLDTFKQLRKAQASGGGRRIKKRTRRHKKKRGKKTRGKRTRANRTKH